MTEGPFADFNGTVEEVGFHEKGRLKVPVSIFRPCYNLQLSLNFGQVEKIQFKKMIKARNRTSL